MKYCYRRFVIFTDILNYVRLTGLWSDYGRVHTCSGREPDFSVPVAIGSSPVKLKRLVHTATGTRTVLT